MLVELIVLGVGIGDKIRVTQVVLKNLMNTTLYRCQDRKEIHQAKQIEEKTTDDQGGKGG